MKPIEPEELSAYIDGELDAWRMREVDIAIANDPILRLALETIGDADKSWRLAANSAGFEPSVQLPARAWLRSPALTCAAVLLLLIIRALPKLSETAAVELLVQVPVLIALMIWVVALTRRSPDAYGLREV